MDGIDRDAVAGGLLLGRWRNDTIRLIEQTLIVARIVLLVEAGGKAEIGELDVTLLVDENVVGLDVTGGRNEIVTSSPP